jgi:hypothetical protein
LLHLVAAERNIPEGDTKWLGRLSADSESATGSG